jgi:hypothetical protein
VICRIFTDEDEISYIRPDLLRKTPYKEAGKKMKSRILTAVLLAALFVPAAAFADEPTGQDRANAARACSALRTSMGDALFKQTYGTVASNRRNAFGKCVSKMARAEHQSVESARSACSTEQSDPNFAATHGGKSFDEFYGTGPKGANAFGRCVSSKARAASLEKRRDTMNAARQCQAERKTLGASEFRTKYGRNKNDRNAFGKCVSKLAQAQND